jgi:hypothetical protein
MTNKHQKAFTPKIPVLILSFSPLDRDPRVQRQIHFLKNEFDITAAGYSNPGIEGIEFIGLPNCVAGFIKKGLQAIRLKTGKFEEYYWNISAIQEARKRITGKNWRLIIANDLFSIPLATEIASDNCTKILADAHEYEPQHFDDTWHFNFFLKDFWNYIARNYLPKTDAMTTVCDSIASKYSQNFNISCSVITNATDYHTLEPIDMSAHRIRMIHHGICNPSRRLENMIDLMTLLDERFELDMMLIPDNQRYYRKLLSIMKGKSNIRILPPIPMREIVPYLNSYDIGLFLLSPKAYNYRMALPNKLFEYIQARLGIAIWPSPEMATIVHKYNIGVVADDFSVASAAKSLNQLSVQDIMGFKYRSHGTASILSSDMNKKRLLSIVHQLVEDSS